VQAPRQGNPPVGILFDTGLGNRIDEALALALLYGLDGKGEARVIALSVSKPNLKAAALCEAIARFYAGASNGAFGAVGRTLPIGLAERGNLSEDTPMLTVPLARRGADGKPLYSHGIEKLTDTAEVRALIRNALAQQPDQGCIVVLTGPATNLAQVLDLPGAKEIIKNRVRLLSLAGGAYPNGAPQFNIKADVAAAKKLFAEWPTPIVAVGEEVGTALPYPAASIEKDFAWSPAHPIADAYRAHQPMPYDAPTAALSAVLHAIRPQENYFKLSEPGTISVLEDGRTQFTPTAEGQHRYAMLEATQQERVLNTFIELASAKPVPRQPRFRRPPQQVEPPKPVAPKPG
jgi:inosine-uridine nucleoside N-ribohydrolase